MSSFFGSFRSGAIGSLIGIVAYAGWLVSRPSRLAEPASWQVEGPIKWFMLAGFVVGALGGLKVLEDWLEVERDDLRDSTWVNGVFVVAVIVIGALLVFSLRR